MEKLGERLKRIRIANNMNQVELARVLNVSKQSISNWENNNILPSIMQLRRICDLLSCSSDYLLGLKEEDCIRLGQKNLTIEQMSHIQSLINDLSVANSFGHK